MYSNQENKLKQLKKLHFQTVMEFDLNDFAHLFLFKFIKFLTFITY